MAAEIEQFLSPTAEKQIAQTVKLMNDLGNSYEKAFQNSKKLDQQITKTSKKQSTRIQNKQKVNELEKEEARILSQNEKTRAKLEKINSKSNKILIANQQALQKRNKELKTSIALENKQIGTLEKLRLTNQKLRQERDKLNLSTTTGRARLQQINKELDKNNKQIKDNNDQLGKQKINIGNYRDALGGLPGPLGSAVSATNKLTAASLRFIATPIGAVIAALAVAVSTLTTFFKGSEEGQNEWNKITKAASVIFGNFKDIVIDIGKGLFKLVNLDFKGAKEAFTDAADGVKTFVSESREELKIQLRLSDLRAKNIVLQRELTVETAKIARDTALLREEAAKNEETNAARSAQLIRDAIALQDDLLAKREEVAQNNFDILREEAELSASTTETLDEVAQAEAELISVQTERANVVKRLTKELNTLEKKAIQQEKQRAKAAEKASEEQVRIIQETGKEIEALQPDVESQLDLYVPNTDALKERLAKNLEEQQKYEDQLAELEKQKAQERAKEREQIAKSSVGLLTEIFTGFQDLRLRQLSDESNALELQRQTALEGVQGQKDKEAQINAQFDRKQAVIKQRQWKAEQQGALFQIAIQTAVNAVEAFKGGPALIALALGLGIAQAAFVKAQRPPKFAKGSKGLAKDTYGEVGDAGPELLFFPGGHVGLATEPTKTLMPKGTVIKTNAETQQILAANQLKAGAESDRMFQQNQGFKMLSGAIAKDREAVIKAMDDKNNVMIETLLSGIFLSRKTNRGKTTYLDKRLR